MRCYILRVTKRPVLTLAAALVWFNICFISSSSARRVNDLTFSSDYYVEQIAARYEDLWTISQYSDFEQGLKRLSEVVSEYYQLVYFGDSPIDFNSREQLILSSVAFDMVEIIDDATSYAKGMATDIFKQSILLLSNDTSAERTKKTLQSRLTHMIFEADLEARIYAMESLAALAKSVTDLQDQDDLVLDIAMLLGDNNTDITNKVIRVLEDIFSSVEISHEVRHVVIEKLISLYSNSAGINHLSDSLGIIIGANPSQLDNLVPDSLISFYISQYADLEVHHLSYNLIYCLRVAVRSDSYNWRESIDEMLSRYDPINRKSVMSLIFGE
jgi:hypothetical protein